MIEQFLKDLHRLPFGTAGFMGAHTNPYGGDVEMQYFASLQGGEWNGDEIRF